MQEIDFQGRGFSAEPYFGHPPADVKEPKSPKTNYPKDDGRADYWKKYIMGGLRKRRIG
jgi:hypothetical protein